MKRILIVLGIMIVGIIALLEKSGKQKRKLQYNGDNAIEYDEVWWDN